MGKFFKINVLSIQLKKEMEGSLFSLPTHSLEMRKASQIDTASNKRLPSFKAFVKGFQAMNSEAPETQKVHLIDAPTGSGKTTRFIAEMVAKDPEVLLVLCLPRRLACNVAVYLRSQYELNVAVKHGKVKESVSELVSPDTQVLIMTYRSAVNMIIYSNDPSGRQMSIIFDECHESCYEACLLFRLFKILYHIKPDWLHSLFCVSATMDAVELSKRLNIKQELIEVSKIEAPPKTFTVDPTEVIEINLDDDCQQNGKRKETEDKEDEEDDEDEETPKTVPNQRKRMQGFARKYRELFIITAVEKIINAPKNVGESTLVITDGVNSAKAMIRSLANHFKTSGVKNVVFWNTFVQQECPVINLSTCHLIIIGSHAKLSSSITFPICTDIHISDFMKVATQDRRDATVQLFSDLVPKSVLDQCFGRADRDVETKKQYYPASFPSDFQITRPEYPKQDEVSDFILDYIDVSVSRIPTTTHAFCSKYNLKIKQAEEIFSSQVPLELLLSLHRYAKTNVSEEEKHSFQNSLNVLRALAHTAAYFSDDDHRLVKPTTLSHVSNGNFSQLVGKFVLHIMNKVCGCPTEQDDSRWESILGVSQKTMDEMVLKTKLSINKDGMEFFKYNGIKDQINPDMIIDAIAFSRKYALELLPFFLKHNPDFMFPTTAADEDDDDQEIDQLKLNGFSMLPYWTLKTVGGVYISPSFIVSLGSFQEKKPQQQQYECVDSAKPQPRQPQQQQQQQCARGGSVKPQPQQQQQQQCARGGSAQQQPQQPQKQQCASGGSAQQQPRQQQQQQQQQCASGGSAQQQPRQPSQPQRGGSAKSKISAK